MLRSSRYPLVAAAVCALLASAALAQKAVTRLIVNGTVASTSVRIIDGRAYVPVADVARALDLTVVERPDAYELTRAGGANQVEGQRGRIGDMLFNGKWRFQVTEAAPADSYTMVNKTITDYAVYHTVADYADNVFRPRQGNTLYVVKCVLKNGLHDNQALWFPNADTHTALTDSQGQSYPPIAIDIPATASFQSRDILPGAAVNLAAVFAVPAGYTPKDLVFTLRTIGDKGSDVRVSLAH